MKPTNTLKITCLTVALGVASSLCSRGQDSPAAPQPEEGPASQAGQDEGANRYSTENSTNTTPKHINKASKLIGMEVVNQDEHKLGKISDIVIDFQKGSVAYAVLEVGGDGLGGLLNIGNYKLIAVPLAAFKPSSDAERAHLTLHVDMEKFSNATGFDVDNWPSIDRPMWGAEPFWQTESSAENAGQEPGPSTTEPGSRNPSR